MAKKEKNEEEAIKPKKSKLKIIIILIIVLLLIVGGAAGFWWFQLRTPEDPVMTTTTNTEQTESTEQTSEQESAENQEMQDGEAEATQQGPQTVINLVNIPTVTVNLADTDPIRYLKLGMDIELTTSEAANKVKSQLAKVRDAIIIALSSKTYDELATTTGKVNVKNEISTRLNQIIGAPRVVQIYFTEFVIQ